MILNGVTFGVALEMTPRNSNPAQSYSENDVLNLIELDFKSNSTSAPNGVLIKVN